MASENGKVVKKNTVLHDSLELKPYPWLHFSDKDLIFPDNPRKSIVLARFHDPEEIKFGITSPQQFKKKLQPSLTPLLPVDLTKDYLASQEEMMVRRRRRLLDEDEAMALELADLVGGRSDINAKWRSGDIQAEEPSIAEPSIESESIAHDQSPAELEPDSLTTLSSIKNLEEELNQNSDQKNLQVIDSDMKNSETMTFDSKILNDDLTKKNIDNNINIEKINKEFLELKKEEAYNSGYNDSELKNRNEIDKIKKEYSESLEKSLSKLSILNTEMIESGKDIFIDIIKMSAKSLLQKELSIHDEVLHNLFFKVIENVNKSENLNIEINPSDLERLNKINENNNSFKNLKIIENKNLKNGDFKIEVNHESLKFELQKLIDNFVDKLKKDMFDQKKDVGEDN